jgi:nucleotide-binding universal stress UspA family protein
MYRRILAAVNEHVNSEIAGRYAMHLARTSGAKLLLCSVHEPDQAERSFDLAKEAARRLQHRARELGIEADSLFEAGDPVRRIGAIVRSESVDLVFAATRRTDIKRRFYAGRTAARRLLLRLPCAVAVVRVVHLGRTHPSEILVPLKARIDHIPERAEFTALLAKAFDARIHLFHVTRPIVKFFHGEKHLTPLEWEERHSPDIARFMDHLDGYGIAHERRVTPGRAGRSIAIEAAWRRRDLIVMGASERSIVEHLLRGAPVEEVLRETTCNLIIFNPGK